jgi:hypothetical protein
VSFLARLGVAPVAKVQENPTFAVPPAHWDRVGGKPPVLPSADLSRVIALPFRELDPTKRPAEADALEARLRASKEQASACKCRQFGRPCPTSLLPVQAHALLEAPKAGGLVGGIGVGHGKTLIDLLLPMAMGSKVAVLLIPANLKAQLLDKDWHYYGAHWNLPNLAGGQWFVAGKPVLHVITYNALSSQKASDLLAQYRPDLIIADEAHNLADPKSARTIRFLRYIRANPSVRGCYLSGTLTKRSITDWAHLAEHALKENSPLPLHPPTLANWATALDPSENAAPPGALERLIPPGPRDPAVTPTDLVRDGFRRRRNGTLGVVATSELSVGASLVIRERKLSTPPEVRGYISQAHGGVRPDGEEFVEALQIRECAWQLASGFYHRWRFPQVFDADGQVITDDGERAKVIADWYAKRGEWNRELREKLKRPKEHLDSPGLLTKAALRAYRAARGLPYEEDKPRWNAAAFADWYAVHKLVTHVTQAVWVDDFLVKDAAKWIGESKKPGIVWVEFPELGERIAKAAGVPFYGGGPQASAEIIQETGKRSIVASIPAHHAGKNLQMFCRNLVVHPQGAAVTEQLIGRTHRAGTRFDEIDVDVYLHTDDLHDAFAKARDVARFIQLTEGPQRLCFASYEGL